MGIRLFITGRILRTLYRRTPSQDVLGLRVVVLKTEAPAVDRIRDALALVDRHAAGALQDALRSDYWIVVQAKSGPYFDRHVGCLFVGHEWLEAATTEFVASALYYHLVRARLLRHGPGEAHRLRVDRTAFERRLAFCRRLPNGEELVARLTHQWDAGLVLPDSQTWERGRAGFLDDRLQELEAVGAPPWLMRIARRYKDWRELRRQRR